MNELVRHFCVDFFKYKKVDIFLNSLFFTSIFYFKKSILCQNTVKKID